MPTSSVGKTSKVGSGLPPCRRASARRRRRIRKLLRSSHQSCLNGIVLNVPPNPLKPAVPHQMIVTLVLPKRCSGKPEHPQRLMRREPLQRSQPIGAANPRGYKHMHMIGHDHKGVQVVAPKSGIAVFDGSTD